MLKTDVAYVLNLLNRLKKAYSSLQEVLGWVNYNSQCVQDTIVILTMLSASTDNFSSDEWDFIELLLPIYRDTELNQNIFCSVRTQAQEADADLPDVNMESIKRAKKDKNEKLFAMFCQYASLLVETYSAFFPVPEKAQVDCAEFLEKISSMDLSKEDDSSKMTASEKE